jgi:hypothetical protein
VLDEDEYLIKLWRAIKADVKQVQVCKFIQSANLMFDVVSIAFSYIS